MKEIQLDIFTFNDDENIDKVVNSIRTKLSKYKSVNKKYLECFVETSTPLLNTIRESLESDKDYGSYITDLVEELKKIAPYYDNGKSAFDIKGKAIIKQDDIYIYKISSFEKKV